MTGRIHFVLVWIMLFPLFLPGVASADNAAPGNIHIEKINIVPPSGTCQYKWEAWVKNAGAAPFAQQIVVQGLQGGASWAGATGAGISNLAAGESRKVTGRWVRRPGMTQFKVELRYMGATFESRGAPLPQEPAPNAKIGDIELRDNGYTVNVENRGMYPVTGLTVQCYKAPGSTPDQWSPGGGGIIECIPAGGTGQRKAVLSSGWNSGYALFKYKLFRGGSTVDEKIVDTRTGAAGQSDSSQSSGSPARRIIPRSKLKDRRLLKRP